MSVPHLGPWVFMKIQTSTLSNMTLAQRVLVRKVLISDTREKYGNPMASSNSEKDLDANGVCALNTWCRIFFADTAVGAAVRIEEIRDELIAESATWGSYSKS